MYLEVYPDIIFILNFTLDIILLFLMKKINRKVSSIAKRILAAASGALIAVIVGLYPWMNVILRFAVMNLAAAALMLIIAFGRMKMADFIKQMIILYLITYFIGGLMNSIYYNTNMRLTLIHLGNSIAYSNISWRYVAAITLIILPIGIFILWLLRWNQRITRDTLELELFFGNRSITTKGFIDTGNCLYDPINGKPVIIIENTLLDGLLPPEYHKEFNEFKGCLEGKNFELEWSSKDHDKMLQIRMIPYQSIGKEYGMMPGLILDKVLVHKGKIVQCNEKVTAAICENHLSLREDYHVIWHKELVS